MTAKRHYPDRRTLKTKTTQVGRVILALVKMDVEIIGIDFRPIAPVIEVYNCPGTRNIKAIEDSGIGLNDSGCYVRKKAFIKGCSIEWSEQK